MTTGSDQLSQEKINEDLAGEIDELLALDVTGLEEADVLEQAHTAISQALGQS